MAAKNLGQVAGLFIGSIAPTNHALIWYDTVTNVHKTYDVSLNSWVVLDPRYITGITYSGLVTRAAGDGLTQGQWYKILDKGNVLALAITATKVQYVNNNGVLVIDDLGTHIIYTVTSENLIIDDITGVYDATTNQLVFSFAETTPVLNTGDTNVDYILGEQKRGNAKTFKKFRISSFLSTVTGNDLTWNSGFFFNFYSKLTTYFDVNNGIVSHGAFEQFKTLNNQAHQSLSDAIDAAVTPVSIYGKQLPDEPSSGTAVDIHQGDSLKFIITKIQRWINRLKIATGINLPSNYEPYGIKTVVIAGDSINTAIAKLDKYARSHESGRGITVTDVDFVEPIEGTIWPTDTLLVAIEKLLYKVTHIGTGDIVDEAVVNSKISDGAVSQSKIADGAVNTVKIADNAVTTAKIANGAVTPQKLANMLVPCCRVGYLMIESANVRKDLTDVIGSSPAVTGGERIWRVKTLIVNENCDVSIDSNIDSRGSNFPLQFFVHVLLYAHSAVKVDSETYLTGPASGSKQAKIMFEKAPDDWGYKMSAWEVQGSESV